MFGRKCNVVTRLGWTPTSIARKNVTQTTLSGVRVKLAIVTIVLAAVSIGASAEQRGATFGVAVTVPVRVSLDVIDEPAALELTTQDVARGYKDIAVRYRVRHNDRRG